jgi:hypothetical protein
MSAPPPAPAVPAATRRRLYVFSGAVALIAVLVASGYLVYGASNRGPSATSIVVSYLRALARSDAAAALAMGTAPADRSRLTPQVLHSQQELAPIHDITVVDSRSGDYGAVVRVKYLLGQTPVDDEINVIRRGTGWALPSVAVNVEVSGASYLPAPTALGVPLADTGEVWMFPGVLTFGSTQSDFALTPSTAVFTDPDAPAMVSPQAVLTPGGRSAATAALQSALGRCVSSRSLAPADCPQRIPRSALPGLRTGTARWQQPAGYGALSYTVDDRHADLVHASGRLTFSLEYRATAGRHIVSRKSAVAAPVSATIDFSTEPPVARLS